MIFQYGWEPADINRFRSQNGNIYILKNSAPIFFSICIIDIVDLDCQKANQKHTNHFAYLFMQYMFCNMLHIIWGKQFLHDISYPSKVLSQLSACFLTKSIAGLSLHYIPIGWFREYVSRLYLYIMCCVYRKGN